MLIEKSKKNTAKFLKKKVSKELNNILNYWENHTIDIENGGFIGEVDDNDVKNEFADKGAVLNARILWTFSAAYPVTKKTSHLEIAERAFEYISKFFYDAQYSGIFWSLNYDGTLKDTKNQVYALAFTIYGLSEYYKISGSEKALRIAIVLFRKIEEKSYDKDNKGYLEAFKRNWEPIEDLRLSDKDANEKKTMNTHLHIVEAYANLYLVWPNPVLKKKNY